MDELGVSSGRCARTLDRTFVVPRYEAITRGSSRTAAGGPSAITRPASRQYTRSEMPMISGMSCSMTSIAAPSSRRIAHDQGTEGLGLPLGDAAGRLVEAAARGRRRRAASASSTMRRVPVERFGDELVGVAPEAEEVDELVGLGALAPLGSRARWKARHRRHAARALACLERDHDRLAHGERREQAGRLEAAAETDAGAGGTRAAR